MSPKVILRVVALLLVAFSFSAIRLAAQDDAPSVADAARRARQQKQDSTKPAHVIDNDTLPPSPAAANSSPDANPTAPAGDASASPAAPKAEGAGAEDEQKKADFEALKKQVADKKAKVDLQQRELSLAQDSYYTNPDRERDKVGKEKLDSMQSDLTQAQAELADLQAKLAAFAPPSDSNSGETAKH